MPRSKTIGKAITTGTHRTRTPEETWRSLTAVFGRIGITRVGDLSNLDEAGLPVALAVRPAATTLVVASGKGITPLLAQISAAMESVELWHAENAPEPVAVAPATAMDLLYRLEDLPQEPDSLLGTETILAWQPAVGLVSGQHTFVPDGLVRLCSLSTDRWSPPLLQPSSNGLAGGNTYAEACLHGLLEIVERDCLFALRSAPARRLLSHAALTGAARDLLDRLQRHGSEVWILDITGTAGIPTYQATIRSETVPIDCTGSGCHLDPEVAICRALTEAVQNRVGLIAGTRDDIPPRLYMTLGDPDRRRDVGAQRWPTTQPAVARSNQATDDIAADLGIVAKAVMAVTGVEPMAVDLANDGVGIAVARTVAPGLRFRPAGVRVNRPGHDGRPR